MLKDDGLKEREAQLAVRSFYSAKPLAQDPRYQDLLTDHPQKSFVETRVLFRPRFVYPHLASLLYRWMGFEALIVVSIAAYVIGVMSVYFLVASFSPPWVAFLGACIFGINPEIRMLGAAALTDMLAVALWAGALAFAALYVQRFSKSDFFLYAFSVFVLALTRPILYLPIGASVGGLVTSLGRDSSNCMRTRILWPLVLITVAAGLFLTVVSVLTHAPAVNAVRWGYERSIELGHASTNFGHWYMQSVAQTIRSWWGDILRTGAIIGWVAILAKLRDRSDSVAPLLAGAGVASIVGVILNPIPSDLARVIEAPLWPVVIAGYAIALNSLLKLTPLSKQRGVT